MTGLAAATSNIAQRPKSRQGSGQGLLLVILGEFVWRKRKATWSSDLVAALLQLGVSEHAARKAINRATRSGTIEMTRHGRQARCTISNAGDRLLQDGAARVFGFRSESLDWDGRWLVVTVKIPEAKRNTRHYLQSHFRWTGMGSPIPGVWISPHTDIPVGTIIGKSALQESIYSYIGSFGPVGQEASMVRAAWDIQALERRYKEFIAEFRTARPQSRQAVFCTYVELLQAWRQFPYLDPRLPRQFLPNPWIGHGAVDFMHEKRDAWSAGANEFWEEIQATGQH